MAGFDIWVNNAMYNILAGPQGKSLSLVASWVSTFGSIYMIVVLCFVGMLCLVLLCKWRLLLSFVIAIGTTAALTDILKYAFMRSRPSNALLDLPGSLAFDPSFPSKHAALAAAFFVVLAYFITRKVRNSTVRVAVLFLCSSTALIIGASRIVLNVHWVSDVLVGWLLGVAVAAGAIFLVKRLGIFRSSP